MAHGGTAHTVVVRFSLDLDDRPVGELEIDGGDPSPFDGWMALLAALGRVSNDHPV